MDIQIKLDTKKFVEGLKKEPAIAMQEINKAVVNSTRELRLQTIRNAPAGKNGPATLRNKIIMEIKGFIGKVISQAPYSVYVHEGTRPHIILPKIKKALAFEIGGTRGYTTSKTGSKYYKAKSGKQIITKVVQHPGTTANPFMSKAIEETMPKITKYFQVAVDNISKKISK